MNVLIDTNIVLDVLLSRAGLKEGSANILKYCESKFVNGYISAMTVANITYILRKDLNREKVLVILSKIFCILDKRKFCVFLLPSLFLLQELTLMKTMNIHS